MGEMSYANANHQIISVDLTGPLHLSSQGNRYIPYIVDHVLKLIPFRVRQTNMFGMHLQIIICHGVQRH